MRTLFLVAPLALLAGSPGWTAAAAQQEAASPEKKLKTLVDRLNKERNDAGDAYDKAKTEEERQKVLAAWPGKGFIPEFRALAEESKGTDAAVKAWMWVLRLTDSNPKQAWETVQMLLAEYIQSPALSELPGELRYGADKIGGAAHAIDTLRKLVEDSPHEEVRAGALFTLGAVLLESGKEESKREGRDCFEAVIAEYGALHYTNTTYKAAAEGFLFELDHLQLGMAAPDFETTDENGAAWRLSDYKGKVVVVDFWGNW